MDLSSFQGRKKSNFRYLEVVMRWRHHCLDKEEITREHNHTLPTIAWMEESHRIPTASQPTLPTAFRNSLVLWWNAQSCSHRWQKEEVHFFFPTKNSFWKNKKDKKEKSTYRVCCTTSKEWQCRLIGQNYNNVFFTRIFQSSCSYWLQKGTEVCFLKTSNTQYIKIVICKGFSDPWKPSSMLKGSTTNSSPMRKSTIK